MASDKVMFAIYREPSADGSYGVVYFTELDDHNRETEINRALRGEHLFNGFIKTDGKHEAKEVVNRILQRLNSGEILLAADIERELRSFMP